MEGVVKRVVDDMLAGAATTVARAGDERLRREGLAEDPDGYAARAEAMRDSLRTLHASASPEEAAALLELTRDVLGGVWDHVWSETYGQRHSYIRRGAVWVWGLLGRSLGVPESGY